MMKVLVAMSGGVDSSVAAALLKKQGYFVTGAYMKNFSQESWLGILEADCPWEKDVEDARAVCDKLGIEFRSFNFEKEYREKVIEYFFAEYAAGRTPNPDVMCNKEIKFGLFLKKARELGFDYIATGHYARVSPVILERSDRISRDSIGPSGLQNDKETTYELLKGLDPKKDQSYFLYTLTQEQLKHTLFPIGKYTKVEVRELARKFGLPNAEKKDSQGICFVGHVNLREFLKQRIPERVGEIVDSSGRVIGQHPGAWYYTIGQRHGLGLGGGTPYYVTAKDTATNQVMVAEKNSPSPLFNQRGGGGGVPNLYAKSTTVRNVHWINNAPPPLKVRGAEGELFCQAKIRYQQPDQPCWVTQTATDQHTDNDRQSVTVRDKSVSVRVTFSEPQFAIAPGQSIVFYEGDKVLGGGTIENVLTP